MLQHDLPPFLRGQDGPRLMETTHVTPCAFPPKVEEFRHLFRRFSVTLRFRGSAKELRRKAKTPPYRLRIRAIGKQNVTAKARMAAPLTVC
jgi:hypothetical protein